MGKDSKQFDGNLIFQIVYLIILSLVIWARTDPKYLNWGVNHFGYLSDFLFYSCIAISLVLFAGSFLIKSDQLIKKIIGKIKELNRFVIILSVSAVLFVIFYLIRVKFHLYGDGLSMIDILTKNDYFHLIGQERYQFVSMFFYRVVTNTLMSIFGVTAESAIAIINILISIFVFWAVVKISIQLGDNISDRTFLIVGALSSSFVILFFGYIENYVLPLCFSLWSLNYLLRYLNKISKILPGLIFTLLAFFSHAVTLPIVIVLLIAVLISKDNKFSDLLKSNKSILAAVVLSVVFMLIYQIINEKSGMKLPYFFLPVYSFHGNEYWFLSYGHLVDFINMLLLMTPVVVVSVLLFVGKVKVETDDKNLALLKWYVSLTLLVSFWLDPTIGALRDFDLLGLPSIPLGILIIYLSIKKFNWSFKSSSIMIMFALIVITVVPNILEKRDKDTVVDRLDSNLFESPQYQVDYQGAYRCISFGWMLEKLEEFDRAKKYYWRRLGVVKDAEVYHYLGRIYIGEKKYDSAIFCYDGAIDQDPNNCEYYRILAFSYFSLQQVNIALDILDGLDELCEGNGFYYSLKGGILSYVDKPQDALPYLKKAYEFNKSGRKELFNLAYAYFQLKKYDSSYIYMSSLLNLDPKNLDAYRLSVMMLRLTDRNSEAEAIFRKYQPYHPTFNSIEQLLRK